MTRCLRPATVSVLAAALALAGCGDWTYCCDDDHDCPPYTAAIQIMAEGPASCIAVPSEYHAQAFVFRTQAAWENFWNDHLGCGALPVPPAPAVDFNLQTAVAVVLSERPTTGYSVRIDVVTCWCGNLDISAVETVPGAGCGIAPVHTRPFQIIVVDGVYSYFLFSRYSAVTVDCP
jgi:hypothetical protein